MGVENNSIEIIDNEDLNWLLNKLEAKSKKNIEDKEIQNEQNDVLNQFNKLEKWLSVDLDLWIWRDWKYYIIEWKDHSNYLKVWLNNEEILEIIEELPKLLDKNNKLILSWDNTWRVILISDNPINILWKSLNLKVKESKISYDFTKWKNWKKSDNFLYWTANNIDNKKMIIWKNNRIEEIFKFIKYLRNEIINISDIEDWICKWEANQECINNLWMN